MLLYTVIKEVNPPQLGGTATGVVNFLNFTLSALLAPVFAWVLQNVSGDAGQRELQHYQTTFVPLLYGVGIAMLLTLLLKETGSAVRAVSPKREHGEIGNESSNRIRTLRTTSDAVRKPGADSNFSGISLRSDGVGRSGRCRGARIDCAIAGWTGCAVSRRRRRPPELISANWRSSTCRTASPRQRRRSNSFGKARPKF